MSKKEFARRKGINYRKFCYRIRSIQKEAPELLYDSYEEGKDISFEPVPEGSYETDNAENEQNEKPCIRIHFSDVTIEINERSDHEYLKEVMEVISSC